MRPLVDSVFEYNDLSFPDISALPPPSQSLDTRRLKHTALPWRELEFLVLATAMEWGSHSAKRVTKTSDFEFRQGIDLWQLVRRTMPVLHLCDRSTERTDFRATLQREGRKWKRKRTVNGMRKKQ